MAKYKNKRIILCHAFLIVLSLNTLKITAQTPISFIGSGSGTNALGPSTANQTITFYTNSTTPYSPTTTATFVLSNQQFASIVGNSTTPGTTMGALTTQNSNTISAMGIYGLMNVVSASTDANYTACNSCTVGTGIAVASNEAIELFNSTNALVNSSGTNLYALNARVQYADITINFNRPVSNPMLQFTGSGAYSGITNNGIHYDLGFTTELDLLTSGITMSKKSGNAALTVTSTTISNSSTYYGSPTTPTLLDGILRSAASGTIVLQGENITTVSFRIYIRGDGGTITDSNGNSTSGQSGQTPNWAGLPGVAGDQFLIGFSLQTPVTVSGNVFNDPDMGFVNNSTGTTNLIPSGIYANLIDNNGKVVTAVAVNTDGTYSIPSIFEGTYTVVISTTQGTQGSAATSSVLPTNWFSTGEFNGTPNTGTDGTVDGKSAAFTVASTNVTNINFGIKMCQTVTNPSAAQTKCVGVVGSNITVNTNLNYSNSIKFVKFTTKQMAGSTPTAAEAAAIYAGTAIANVTPTGSSNPYTATYTFATSDFPNATSSPIIYYVYAIVSPDPGASCEPAQEIQVTINPTPQLSSTLTPSAICSATTFSYTPTSATSGATFAWSRALVTGISQTATSGTGNISETLTNTTTAPINVVYVFTTTANGCASATQNVTVTVNPKPQLSSILTPSAICGGTIFSYTPTSATSGATFAWSRALVTGISQTATSGTGNISETLTNTTTAPINVVYVFTTTANGCASAIQNVTVTVNPKPQLSSSLTPSAICSATTFSYIPTSATSGATFAWSRALVTGISQTATSGTGNISETLTNTTTAPINVVYVFTTTANGCASATQNVTVAVYPKPTVSISSTNTTVCVNGSAVFTATNDATYIYQWQSSPDNSTWTNISGATTYTYTAPTSATGTIYYRVAVTQTGNPCAAVNSAGISVTVNAIPVVSITSNVLTICVNGSINLAASYTGGTGTCSYQWQKSTDNGATWLDVSGATTSTYSTTLSSTGTPHFRAKLTCTGNGCCN